VEEELKKYVSVGGWVQIEKVKEWLGLEPTGGECSKQRACTLIRIEMGEVQGKDRDGRSAVRS
jgi:hypothetical protein